MVLYYIDGRKTAKKYVESLIGADKLAFFTRQAKETYEEDVLIQNDFNIGGRHMLTIKIRCG